MLDPEQPDTPGLLALAAGVAGWLLMAPVRFMRRFYENS